MTKHPGKAWTVGGGACLLGAWLSACASASPEENEAQEKPLGGAADGSAICSEGHFQVEAVPERAEGCLDIDAERWTLCASTGPVGPSGLQCIEHGADGQRAWYWVPGPESNPIETSGYAPCVDASPPAPCPFRACEIAPATLCTEAGTREHFRCGDSESDSDEDCCQRPICSSDAECSPGSRCAEVYAYTAQACFSFDGYCDCGGVSALLTVNACVPGP
jgi:hypothetical protein